MWIALDFVMHWLKKQSNVEHQALVNGIDLYRNISLLFMVGHGDEITKEFDLKVLDCVSNNFDSHCWRELKKKLLGSPLAAKVIGGVLKDNLDERH
ncbi:hypothetical protein IEQ34_017268 [Dendrobium chrysotoxum]|uniref:Uncharacterized protein n=1 Tax=Dendrobium chrysotoxum TaxID=161865 RepID=A0AAV7GB25_DENCH|nr:hypothetical protein IEQ34_017268 [Dendrobium chrysotoxum]